MPEPEAQAIQGRLGRWARRALVVLLGLVGATATAGGAALMAGLIAPGTELLQGSPFATYLVPGLLLLAIGVLHLAVAWLVRRPHPRDWFWAGFAGGAMLVFEVVEYAIIGYHWLQMAYAVAGALTGLLALALLLRGDGSLGEGRAGS